jgi:hypothetical protein
MNTGIRDPVGGRMMARVAEEGLVKRGASSMSCEPYSSHRPKPMILWERDDQDGQNEV